MIRMIQSVSAGHAKSYYTDALLKSDYYLEDQELAGYYTGKLADRLGIEGRADKESFFALCENRHPVTNLPLTPRTRGERTTGYDINFHVPKSVSVVHVLSKDDHILKAFQESVAETMTDIEADAMGRVRKKGKLEDRNTGELLWVDFVHQTARPVEGATPDPHLHAHCYVFNCTWDDQEKQVKAGQFREINRNMPYYQALFHKRMSDRLMDLGYSIRRTNKSFEIAGVPQKVIDHFSKRTNEIGEVAKEKGITDAKALSELGARTRAQKQKGVSMADLKTDWRQQIRELNVVDEADPNPIIRHKNVPEREKDIPRKPIDHAIKHAFERASVMPYRKLAASAVRHSIGTRDYTATEVVQGLKADKRLIEITDNNQVVCTTREVLAEEKRMVELARDGHGRFHPLYDEAPEITLTEQQGEAVKHVLTTSDQVSIIRGVAGAGKTTLMREAIEHIEKSGKTVTVIAPTSNASRDVLRKEGFEKADTVATFLRDETMHKGLKNQVLWVDEAGLLGTQDMKRILEIASQQEARVIFGGDTRQHASVVRGDALRILNTVGGIKSAEVSKIYRQKNAAYREAVEDLAKGDIGGGFQKLDAIGAIKDVPRENANAELVEDYLGYIKQGKSALVIAPTHKQGDEVTDEIRSHLKKAGKIGKKEIKAEKLNNLSLTQAEKADWRSFREGQILQFNQNVTGVKRGSQWSVSKVEKDQVFMTNIATAGTIQVPKDKPDCYDVFERSQIDVAKGDKIRVTRNGFDQNDKRLNNGQVFDVQKVSKKGEILLQNETSKEHYTINAGYGHIAHAHCVTSYGSQGKTVDAVLISQPAETFSATNAKQFYVSVSRGREQVHIYTNDKEELLHHASQMGDRQSAMELVSSGKDKQTEHVHNAIRNDYSHVDRDKQPEIDKSEPTHDLDNDRDYDYGLYP